MRLTKKSAILCLLGAGTVQQASAIPADPSTDPLPVEVLNAVPGDLGGYNLIRDNTENIVYVSPRYGVLGSRLGLPFLSFAKVERGDESYGVLNAAFDFKVDKDDFTRLKTAIETTGWAVAPLPFESTSGTLSINSMADGEENGICRNITDIITGELKPVCSSFVIRSVAAPKGPTLGQLYNVQMVLTGDGTQLYQKLLKGGNGISFNMEANYQVAFPAYTAKLDVNYKKLSESYDLFAAAHYSNCLDVQVSDFFKKESLCEKKDDGSYESLNGNECSIRVSYTNQRGEAKQNLFKLPENGTDAELKQFATDYNEDIMVVHDAIEGLRVKFEEEMLSKYPTASVDKSVNYNFIARADRKRFEDEANFTLERKSVGGAVLRRTTIPGLALCVNTNPETGDVTRYAGNSSCQGFWNNAVAPLEFVGDTDEAVVEEEESDGWF